jgi:hypothetical protein
MRSFQPEILGTGTIPIRETATSPACFPNRKATECHPIPDYWKAGITAPQQCMVEPVFSVSNIGVSLTLLLSQCVLREKVSRLLS